MVVQSESKDEYTEVLFRSTSKSVGGLLPLELYVLATLKIFFHEQTIV